MINRLIDMKINVSHETITPKTVQTQHNYSVQDYAIAFITGLKPTQKERFKKMLENQIECGMSIAESYGIDYNDFITEVKKLLKVEV